MCYLAFQNRRDTSSHNFGDFGSSDWLRWGDEAFCKALAGVVEFHYMTAAHKVRRADRFAGGPVAHFSFVVG